MTVDNCQTPRCPSPQARLGILCTKPYNYSSTTSWSPFPRKGRLSAPEPAGETWMDHEVVGEVFAPFSYIVFYISYNTGYVQIKGAYDTTNKRNQLKIPSGVTLILPYGNASDATGRNQSGTATETGTDGRVANTILGSDNKPTYERTRVVLCEGVVLIVDGTLEINGKISSKSSGTGNDAAGYTAKDYATLRLEKGAKVEIYGSALIYGFIENVDGNSDSLVTVFNDGNLYLPFTLRDFKGGTILSAIKEGMDAGKGYAPFHQFYFPNVCAKLRINYGGNLRTWCNLYSNDQHNYTEGHMVGKKDSGALLELDNATYSYLEAAYNRETQITDLDIYGGARLNDMSLTVNVLGRNVTVTSSDFIFGLSWLFDITIDNNESGRDNLGNTVTKQENASYIMPDGYKLLPGGKLTIEQGATLTITTLTIYSASDFDDVLNGTYPGTGVYPEVYPASSSLSGVALADGYLLVRGSLIVTNIGGNVYADSDSATVTVSGSTSMTTLEPTCVEKGILTGSVTAEQSIPTVLKLLYVIGKPDIYNNTEESKDNAFAGLIDIDIEYVSSAENKAWEIEGQEIALEIPVGAQIRLPNGEVVSATEATGPVTVYVKENNGVSFILTRGQLVFAQGSDLSSYVVPVGSNLLAALSNQSATYEAPWTVTADSIPVIYSVPEFAFSFSHDGTPTSSSYTITYYNIGTADVYAEVVVTASGSEDIAKNSTSVKVTATITLTQVGQTGVSVNSNGTKSGNDYSKVGEGTLSATATITVTIKITQDTTSKITASAKAKGEQVGSCVTGDTLVTLADGTQMMIKDMTGNEQVLVWNHYTGKADVASILVLFNNNGETVKCDVLRLEFSDGTYVEIIGEHVFFDKTLNKYVGINAINVTDFIGHNFAKISNTNDSLEEVTLVGYETEYRITDVYDINANYHHVTFVNGMLSCSAYSDISLNCYEFFGDNLGYSEELMQEDIEKYGIYTYEDFEGLLPKEIFEAFHFYRLKICVAKGYTTWEEIVEVCNAWNSVG